MGRELGRERSGGSGVGSEGGLAGGCSEGGVSGGAGD